MRKRGFTLVEILIVIVIIGILIGALVPRMQSAQGRARDVARKNDLSQLQSAIVTSYNDKGERPALNGSGKSGVAVSSFENDLLVAGMNSIPKDPLSSTSFSGLGNTKITSGDYGYLIAKRNGTDNGGFVLMAKSEIEGGSNWVVCASGSTGLSKGYIKNSDELGKVQTCTKFVKTGDAAGCTITGGTCTYYEDSELRYILVY